MNATEGFFSVFEVVIQLGAIAAVIVVYFSRLWPFHTRKKAPEKTQFANPEEGGTIGGFQRFADKYLYMDKVVLWLKILISVLPSAVLGLLLDDFRDKYLNNWLVIGIMMLVYGALFVLIELWYMPGRKPRVTSMRKITWLDALLIGAFQCLSLVPGTSRLGVTILGALLIGFSRVCATEYSFFVAIPTMLGASLVKIIKSGFGFTGTEYIALILGMGVAFGVSLVVIRFFIRYLKKHDFIPFGFYRIALGILILILLVAGVLSGGSLAR
jgi:undecaprenyl-diphosphatase